MTSAPPKISITSFDDVKEQGEKEAEYRVILVVKSLEGLIQLGLVGHK